jgi:electron transfer flavoprotein alpha subunit
MSVLVVLEQADGKWHRTSFEALEAARKLARELDTRLECVVVGSGIDSLAAEAAAYDVAKVWTADDPFLQAYTPEGYTAALEQLIKRVQPSAVLFPHTYQVRDYAPKLAARFGKALVSDVVDLRAQGQAPVYVRQLFQGKLNADVKVEGQPQFASMQAGAFRGAQPSSAAAAIEKFDVRLSASDIRSKPEPPFRDTQRSVDLSAANIIVSVGRGIKEKENIPIVEELAQVLGAELAASRPICDNGWLPMERQVGSSGQTVSPKLYLAVGISGAIQHLVGMKGAKTVVAINKDETAPIFETADYGIAGDLFEVVPALVEELKKVKT